MPDRPRFMQFYRTLYRDEHRLPANVACHLVGVAAGLAVIAASLTHWPLWTILLFPVAHVLPGLLGHRLFERDASVGDIRVTRTDIPVWWFLVANHMLVVDLIVPGRPFGLPK